MIGGFFEKIKSSKYAVDMLLQGSGNAFAQILGVIFIPILTRIFTPEDFGIQNIFLQLVALLAILLTLRLEYFIVLPSSKVDAESLFKSLVTIGVLSMIVTTLLMQIYKHEISHLLGNEKVSIWVVFAPITALFISISIALQQLIQRQQNYYDSGLSEVVNKSGYIGGALLLGLNFTNVAGLIFSTLIGSLSKTVWLITVLYRKASTRILFNGRLIDFNSIRKYSKISGSWSVSHVIQTFTGLLPVLFISKQYGLETLGQLTLVISTLYLPSSVIGNAVGQVYYERASKIFNNGKSFNDLWLVTVKKLLVVGIPIYVFIAIFSQWAYPFVFGRSWSLAGEYASIFAVASALSFVTSPLDRGCLIVGAWWYPLVWNTLRLLGVLIVIWLAQYYKWSFVEFLILHVMQTSILYLVDLFAQFKFSSMKN